MSKVAIVVLSEAGSHEALGHVVDALEFTKSVLTTIIIYFEPEDMVHCRKNRTHNSLPV